MKLKKYKIFSVFILFAIAFLCHFMYDWFPNTFTSIFFPVNESIFEHMKIISTSVLIYSMIEIFIMNKYNIIYYNYLLNIFLTSIIGIFFYLVIFIPIYLLIGENMFVSIFLLFITYIIMQIISYYILKHDTIKYSNIISIIGIVLLYIIFGYFTYNPLKNFLFIDTTTNTYGIHVYEL